MQIDKKLKHIGLALGVIPLLFFAFQAVIVFSEIQQTKGYWHVLQESGAMTPELHVSFSLLLALQDLVFLFALIIFSYFCYYFFMILNTSTEVEE